MMKKIYEILIFLWLFLMLVFPSVYSTEKLILLIILCIIALINGAIIKIDSKKYFLLILLILIPVAFIYFGYINTNILYYKLFEMYILTPIVAILLSSVFESEVDLYWLVKSLIIITLFIGIYDTVYILGQMGIIPQIIDSQIGGSFFIESGRIEARITNQSSLIFLLPMMIILFFENQYKNERIMKVLLNISIFLGAFITAMSGRRALQLVVLLSCILYAITKLKIKKNCFKIIISKKKVLYTVFGIIIFSLFFMFFLIKLFESEFFKSIYETFLRAFDMKFTHSGQVRMMQTNALLDGWANSPLFGHGIGSHPTYLRSLVTPWSYEMVYFSLLYQIGIVGVGFYCIIILIIFKKIKILKNRYKDMYSIGLSIEIGFVSFLIAGATNPMVFYLWAWFIMAVICNIKYKKESKQ